MKYLIVTELSNSECVDYQVDKSDITYADSFEEAKKVMSEKIAFGIEKKAQDVFDENGNFEFVRDYLDDRDESDYEEFEMALLEMEKILISARDGRISEYSYDSGYEEEYDYGCTLLELSPSVAKIFADCENGMCYFTLSAHNMNSENKIYYFDYKDWCKETSFRVVMYPVK